MTRGRALSRLGLTGLLVALLGACTAGSGPAPRPPTRSVTGTAPTTAPSPTPTPTPTPSPARVAAGFDPTRAMADVHALAGGIGPREATTGAYARAAALVARRFAGLGYAVRRQGLRVPAGVSWGVPVGAGSTVNVVAAPPGFRADRPHLLLGAHLDTVPQAPGAEDNGSGVAVLLELARLAATEPPRLPVAFVAFAAEEPRGPGDDQHHFGSQAFLRQLTPAERSALVAVVALDRVGIGRHVPVCTGGLSPPEVQREILASAARIGVPARACENRTSDHWPFEKAGGTVARVGGVDYPEYHSAADRPAVVDPRQLDRTGRVLWEWLTVSG